MKFLIGSSEEWTAGTEIEGKFLETESLACFLRVELIKVLPLFIISRFLFAGISNRRGVARKTKMFSWLTKDESRRKNGDTYDSVVEGESRCGRFPSLRKENGEF